MKPITKAICSAHVKARCGGNISASFFLTIERLHIAQQDLHQQKCSSIEKFETNFHNFCLGMILVQRWSKTMTGPKSRWKHMLMQKWEQRHPQSTLAIRYLLDRGSTSSQHVSIPYHLELCVQMGRWLQHVTIASISLAMCLISKSWTQCSKVKSWMMRKKNMMV